MVKCVFTVYVKMRSIPVIIKNVIFESTIKSTVLLKSIVLKLNQINFHTLLLSLITKKMTEYTENKKREHHTRVKIRNDRRRK